MDGEDIINLFPKGSLQRYIAYAVFSEEAMEMNLIRERVMLQKMQPHSKKWAEDVDRMTNSQVLAALAKYGLNSKRKKAK